MVDDPYTKTSMMRMPSNASLIVPMSMPMSTMNTTAPVVHMLPTTNTTTMMNNPQPTFIMSNPSFYR
jgi:hypothetical protein